MVSLRLAYQDLEVQQKKKDQAMSRMDPKKAQQMERLGMGFGSGAGAATGFGSHQSHSLMSDSGVIVQEEPNSARKAQYHSSTKDNFFDDFEVFSSSDCLQSRVSLSSPGGGEGGSWLGQLQLQVSAGGHLRPQQQQQAGLGAGPEREHLQSGRLQQVDQLGQRL